jgi:polar amino acid transport system substrate-binding protein
MTSIRKLVFAIISLSMFSTYTYAKEVNFIFGLALPPYVIQENSSGFELEIIREALAVKGHSLKPSFSSFSLVTQLLKEKKADGAQRGNPDLVEGSGYCYAANQTVAYQDVAISLKNNKLKINSPADLQGKTVVSFQGASKFLGKEFADAVAGNAKYSESANEDKKTKQLYANGLDVLVGDINIFKYYKNKVAGVDVQQEIVYHKIFSEADIKTNHAVFIDKQICDDFDAGLKQIKSIGKYKEIIKKYLIE